MSRAVRVGGTSCLSEHGAAPKDCVRPKARSFETPPTPAELQTGLGKRMVGSNGGWRKKKKKEKGKRKSKGGVQFFLNSTSSGGLTSTFLLPTSFQLVLRTVPLDSVCTGKGRKREEKKKSLQWNGGSHFISSLVTQHLSASKRLHLKWVDGSSTGLVLFI